MNKKLCSWYFANAVIAVILAVVLFIIITDSNSLKTNLTSDLRTFALSHPFCDWLIFYSAWCTCGFLGTVIEIRADRPCALPFALGIMPLLLIFQTAYTFYDYHPGGMLNFAGLGLIFRLLAYAVPAVPMIIRVIVLIVSRHRASYNFYKQTDSTVCFTKRRAFYIITFVISAVMPVVFIGLLLGTNEAGKLAEKEERSKTARLAYDYYEAADDTIDYSNLPHLNGKMFGTPFRKSTALIDYDEMRVTFLIPEYTEKMYTFMLERVSEYPSGEVQFVCPLEGRGKEFRAYYIDDPKLTSAVTVEMPDGALWCADTENKALDFGSSPCRKIADALERADVTAEYGNNNASDGSLFPRYSMGITRDTFALDRDTMTGWVIESEGGNTWEDVGYKLPYGTITVMDFKFEPFTGNELDCVPAAIIPLGSPEEYILVYYSGDGGILLYTSGGIYKADADRIWSFGFEHCEYTMSDEEGMRYRFPEYVDLDPSDGLVVYVRKEDERNYEWRFALGENNYEPTSDELRNMKFLSSGVMRSLAMLFTDKTEWYFVGVDDNYRLYMLSEDELTDAADAVNIYS
ncbi:MAG: hypothetical protein IK990_13240 [Ruminiclostridium sp.]|nr:hypothetical protein [Ruminiclostridium sp.]